ncbi:MAG: hypothetical protein QXU98_10645, partial [Candidatus Parvarchaeota archaeon]
MLIAIFAILILILYLPSGLKAVQPSNNASVVIGNPNYAEANLSIGMLSAIPNDTINTILLPGGYLFQPYVNYTYSQGPDSSAYAIAVTEAVDLNTICDADYNISSCSGINSTLFSLLSENQNINASMILGTVKPNVYS